MCGILGVIGNYSIIDSLTQGLSRLEYRGYDSAGIAVLNKQTQAIQLRRVKGKISTLINIIDIDGCIGIGHTRWATHGSASAKNAHPHTTDRVAVVHNGIIENTDELQSILHKHNIRCYTETDTEIIPLLITLYMTQGLDPFEATYKTIESIKGAFAIIVLFQGITDMLIAAKHNAPVVLGHNDMQAIVTSDAHVLSLFSNEITYIEDNDFVVLTTKGVEIYNKRKKVHREKKNITVSESSISKENYRHFMCKEIFEQPWAISETLSQFYSKQVLNIANIDKILTTHITIIACGSSYFAALIGKYWLEAISKIVINIELASEFLYREPFLLPDCTILFISQSGETADTLAALKLARQKKQRVISIVNTHESSIDRHSDIRLYTLAGLEISVPSTKTFTSQLIVLACLSIVLAEKNNVITQEKLDMLMRSIVSVPTHVTNVLEKRETIGEIVKIISNARSVLYIGRGTSYGVAMEGALKLKELAYIHAEGIAAGELKHGSIALIDDSIPVIIIAPYDKILFTKILSNIAEIIARGGRVIVFTSHRGAKILRSKYDILLFEIFEVDLFIAPIVYTVLMQLLAYEVAVYRGTDVDQPRNLAKSVTVE